MNETRARIDAEQALGRTAWLGRRLVITCTDICCIHLTLIF